MEHESAPVRCGGPRSCTRWGRVSSSRCCAGMSTRGCASWTKGNYDAIVLAAAGLRRLGWQDRIRELISVEVMCPAVGQGALAIETRDDGGAAHRTGAQAGSCGDRDCAVTAERALLATLGGGCQVPIGGSRDVRRRRTFTCARLSRRPTASACIRGERSRRLIPVRLGEELGERVARRKAPAKS